MSRLSERMRRGFIEHGSKWDDSALIECDASVIRAYNDGCRVRVQNGDHIRTGIVSTTTGWKPSFLLMYRSNSRSSWDTLGPGDVVIAIKHGRTYVSTQNGA